VAARTGSALGSALLGFHPPCGFIAPSLGLVHFRFHVWAATSRMNEVKPISHRPLGPRLRLSDAESHRLNGRLSMFWICSPNYEIGANPSRPAPRILWSLHSVRNRQVPFNQNIVFTGKISAVPPAVGANSALRVAIAWSFAKNPVLPPYRPLRF